MILQGRERPPAAPTTCPLLNIIWSKERRGSARVVAASTGSHFRQLYASRPNMSLPHSGRPALRSWAMCFEWNVLCLALPSVAYSHVFKHSSKLDFGFLLSPARTDVVVGVSLGKESDAFLYSVPGLLSISIRISMSQLWQTKTSMLSINNTCHNIRNQLFPALNLPFSGIVIVFQRCGFSLAWKPNYNDIKYDRCIMMSGPRSTSATKF